MAHSLDNISAELLAWIAQYLGPQDLATLRLVNRDMAQKAIQGSFSRSIRSKRIQLTRKSLQDCAEAISSNAKLGRFIEEVTLVRVICDSSDLEHLFKAGGYHRILGPDDQDEIDRIQNESSGSEDGFVELGEEELTQIEDAIDQLAEQQEEMQNHGDRIKELLCRVFSLINDQAHILQSLSVQVAVLEDSRKPPQLPRDAPRKGRHLVFQAAAQAFSLAMSCIQDLPVASLDIFDASPESLKCSIPCDLLARTTFSPQHFLRSLSISVTDTLSATMIYPQDYRNVAMDRLTAAVMCGENFTGLSNFLKACSALEELRISYYNIPDRKPALLEQATALIQRQMHELAEHVYHPQLRRLSLGGLRVDCGDFITYLTKHRATLQSLELRHLIIIHDTGSLKDVMKCLQDFPLLNEISFLSIHSGGLCLYPKEQESAHTTISGYYIGENAIHRTGDDARKPLEYYHRDRDLPVISNPKIYRARQLRDLEHGHVW